jgi:hypothetical protein
VSAARLHRIAATIDSVDRIDFSRRSILVRGTPSAHITKTGATIATVPRCDERAKTALATNQKLHSSLLWMISGAEHKKQNTGMTT